MSQNSHSYRSLGEQQLSSDLLADAENRSLEKTSGSVKDDTTEAQESWSNRMTGYNSPLKSIVEKWTKFVILGNFTTAVAALIISIYAPPLINTSSILNYDFTSWRSFHLICAAAWYSTYYVLAPNLESCLTGLRKLSIAITGLQCISHGILFIALLAKGLIGSQGLSQPLFSYATFPLLQFSSLISIPIIQLLICVNSTTQNAIGHNSNLAADPQLKDKDTATYIKQCCSQLKDVTKMVSGIIEQYASDPLNASCQEVLSSCSIAMPIASTLAIKTAMKQIVHIASVMQQNASGSLNHSDEQSPARKLAGGINKEFDISQTLQTIGDVMEGVYTKQGVPLVIQLVDSEWKQVNVIGNQGALRHCLICILTSILHISTPGSTVEMSISCNRPEETQEARNSKGNTLKFDIDISLIPKVGEDKIQELKLALDPGNIELFGGSVKFTQISESKGPTVNVSFNMEQGKEINGDVPINDEGVTLINPGSRDSVTISSLEGFYELLKGMKVALYAEDDSLFAKHLTTCLSNWSASVAYFSIGDDDNSEKAEDSLEPRPQLYVRTQHGSQVRGSTSPYHPQQLKSDDSVNPMTADIIIVDDDIQALKQQIANRHAAFAADAALRSRQPLRTKKGNASNRPASQATILHFTSLENYQQVRDIIISNLDPFSKRSFALAHIVAVPKPACPRRILAALYTAWSKTTVGPQYTPIATLPNSPVSTVSTVSSSGQSHEYLSSSAPSSADPHSPEKNSRKMERGLDSPKIRDIESGQYFPSAHMHSSASHIGRHNSISNSSEGSPTGIVVEEGILFSPAPKGTNAKQKGNGIKSQLKNLVPSPGGQATESNGEAPYSTSPKDTDNGNTEPKAQEIPRRPKVEQIGRKDSFRASKSSNRLSPTKSSAQPSKSSITAAPVAQSPQPINEKDPMSIPIIKEPSSLDSEKTDKTQSGSEPSKGDSLDSTASEPGKAMERSAARRLSARKKRKSVSRSLVSPPIKVLIVEDNIINQVILSKWMKNHNITYDVAGNGQIALDKWNSGGFHLILMDIQLPVMDGLTATKKIRACEKDQKKSSSMSSSDSTVPSISSKDSDRAPGPEFRSSVIIVALTASSLDSDRQEALAAGCNDFLTKPVNLDWLERKITEWGSMQALIDYEGWRQWRESKKPTKQGESKQKLAIPEEAAPATTTSPDRSGVLMHGGEAIKRQKRRSIAP
ncbi:hypothetical protein INT43_005661 [Umbelopsis isabellina]|uniref:Response regulatory domain-containing protein n=1 Tax=Mortierella isabellina TaxID=91625 RepID=A0A8H7U8U1_MORIS|nr:hypothetical protein INT43_005661 [Umbelopsis isabellina]